MTEHNEVRASHEEVEAFVGKLKVFHGGLQTSAERAMLETILQGAQAGDTQGFMPFRRVRYDDAPQESTGSESSSSGWNDLVGWSEEQGEEDTQGFMARGKG